MMTVSEALLNQIVVRVLRVARPDRIIVFGSAATGPMTRDSDIDLLIVGEPSGYGGAKRHYKHGSSRYETARRIHCMAAHRYGRVPHDAATYA